MFDKKNVDKDRILTVFKIIDKNIKIIENKGIKNKEDLEKDIDKYYVCSMAIFTILNYVIELGEELIENKNLTFPNKYIDVFKILMQEKIIGFELYKKLQEFIKTRNEIAHEYGEMLESEIYWCIVNISDIKEVLKIVKKELLQFYSLEYFIGLLYG